MATITHWWHRDGEASGDVQLSKGSNGWNHADNVTGVWDSDANAYQFDMDSTDSDIYDPTELYKIYEDSVEILTGIELGAFNIATDLETHIADTTTHGTTGDVVGTSDTQTLTNKTIDGDNNTLQDIAGSSLKTNTILPAIKIQPDAGEDSLIVVDTSSASMVQLNAENAAGSADRTLKILANDVELISDAGAAIKLTGIAVPTDSDGAVPKSVTDDLDARITALTRTDAFTGSPVVSLNLRQVTRGGRQIGASHIVARFGMDSVDNEDAVRRYEIFWGYTDFNWVNGAAAGVISDDDLSALRSRAVSSIRVDGGTGNTVSIQPEGSIHVIVVAFDFAGAQYVSIDKFIGLGVGDAGGRDGGGANESVSLGGSNFATSGYKSLAGTLTGNAATAVGAWTQNSSAAEVTKLIQGYKHKSTNLILRPSFYAKSEGSTGEDLIVSVYIKDKDGTTVASGSFRVTAAAYSDYPNSPITFDIDISDLTHNVNYEIHLTMANTAATDYSTGTFVRQDVFFDIISELPLTRVQILQPVAPA